MFDFPVVCSYGCHVFIFFFFFNDTATTEIYTLSLHDALPILLQTTGDYQLKVPMPFTPGMDAAGVVRSTPANTGLTVGQRVAVLASYGCWQEVVIAPAQRVLPLPEDMSFEAGAAAPLNYLTGLFALVRRGQARAGETLLVHGAAGGVGTAAVQLGRALGLRTVAVVSDEAKKEFALQSGANHAVLSRDWLAAVRELL